MNITDKLATWILALANSTVNRRTGKTGIIKVFANRTQVRGTDGIALDRLIEHCKVTREQMAAALGSLRPLPGNGDRVHIVVVTDERIRTDKAIAKIRTETAKAHQLANWAAFLGAAGIATDSVLPEFENDTIN